MAKKLSDKTVAALKTGAERGQMIYDAKLPGFIVVVYPGGRRVFKFRYTSPETGRRRILILGIYGPHYTEDHARKDAERLKARLNDGVDPLEQEAREMKATEAAERAHREKLTFSQWKDTYLEAVALRKRSVYDDKRYLKFAAERFGHKKLDEVTASDIQRVFLAIAKDQAGGRKSKRVTDRKTGANRWLASVRACLSAAWREGLIPENPALRVKPFPEHEPRTRVLSTDELESLLDAVATLPDPHARLAFAILVDTGCRLSEVLRAKWQDFDLETGRWNLETTKARRRDTKTLPSSTLAMLNNTPRVGPYIIAGRPTGRKREGNQLPPDKPRKDLKRAWDQVCEKAGLKGVHIHDIRRTFGLEVWRRFGPGAASKALGHSSPQVTAKVYAPYQLEDELRITETLAQERAEVIRINRKKRGTGD
jgi:integrase